MVFDDETGDVKVINMLCGLVSFNIFQGGCLYYICIKRECATDPNHPCELLTDKEHKECHRKAQAKFAVQSLQRMQNFIQVLMLLLEITTMELPVLELFQKFYQSL